MGKRLPKTKYFFMAHHLLPISQKENKRPSLLFRSEVGKLWPLMISGKESSCQCRIHRFYPWYGKIPHVVGQLNPLRHNHWARALEPWSCNYWTHVLKPTHSRVHAPWEKPLQWEAHAQQLESNPSLTTTRWNLTSNKDPAQPKVNTFKKII